MADIAKPIKTLELHYLMIQFVGYYTLLQVFALVHSLFITRQCPYPPTAADIPCTVDNGVITEWSD